MSLGAHFGGEGIFLQKVSVQMKGTVAKGFEWWVPARSTHILIAGLAIASSLGALGASLRMMAAQGGVIRDEQAEEELAALTSNPQTTFQPPAPAPAPRRVTDDLSMARTLNADAAVRSPRLPSGRFWLLSSLLFITALGLGVWYQLSLKSTEFDLSHPTASTVMKEMSRVATNTSKVSENRIGVHIVLGISLALFPLLLAVAARFLSRARVLVGALCLLMVLLIAGEVLIGVLLTFRGAEGPIWDSRRPPSPRPTQRARLVRLVLHATRCAQCDVLLAEIRRWARFRSGYGGGRRRRGWGWSFGGGDFSRARCGDRFGLDISVKFTGAGGGGRWVRPRVKSAW